MFYVRLSKDEFLKLSKFIKKHIPGLCNTITVLQDRDNHYSIPEDDFNQLTNTFYQARAYDVAEILYGHLVKRSVQFNTVNLLDTQPQTILYMDRLAECMFVQVMRGEAKDTQQIETLWKQVLDYDDDITTERTVTSIIRLSYFYQYIGRLNEAMKLYDRIIRVDLPGINYQVLVLNLMDLVNQLFKKGDTGRAKVYLSFAYFHIKDHLDNQFDNYTIYLSNVVRDYFIKG